MSFSNCHLVFLYPNPENIDTGFLITTSHLWKSLDTAIHKHYIATMEVPGQTPPTFIEKGVGLSVSTNMSLINTLFVSF